MFNIRMNIESNTKKGFTLIELLIVVAIIAILAAIAIPNYLLAQTRTKVSDMLNDMQVTATALESYYVDNDVYPYYNNPVDSDDHHSPLFLTTPVAYLTSLQLDVFLPEIDEDDPAAHSAPLHYLTEDFSPGLAQGKAQLAGIYNPSVAWILWSIGPDHIDQEGELLYDPTNGTVGPGDLIRVGP